MPPPSSPAPNRLVTADWSLEFEAAGGSGYLKVQHNLGATLAKLHHVRLVLGPARETFLLGLQSAERRDDALVLSCAPHPDHAIEVHLRLSDAGRIEVEVTDSVGLRSEVCELTLDYVLPDLEDPDETWLPHGHAGPTQVAGDGSFHTPVAFVRRGGLAVALLPDRDSLARHRRVPQAIELDRDAGPQLRHGLISHAPAAKTNGGFERRGPIAVHGETLSFGHTLRVYHEASADTSYELFRDLWRHARAETKKATVSLDRRCREFFHAAAANHWIDLSRGKGESGTFLTGLAHETDGSRGVDAWYSVRQQTLRTAYGMLLFAKRAERPNLEKKAGQALAHVLSAPFRGGLIPSIFLVDREAGRREWLLDSNSAGDSDHYHALDVASTGTWMLRLAEHFSQHRVEVLDLCRRTARFFRKNQLDSGAFPSFYEKENLAPRLDRLHDISAETGSVARFLIEYGLAAGDDESIAAARRALEYIEHLLAVGMWHDIESVAPEGPLVDPRSGVHRQGTLGLIQCALAAANFGELQRAKQQPDARWARLCDGLLGQLSRYQQIWSPPWVPGARIGGFGAGNFDHRWNDSRQGVAALAFFAGYRLTDDPQWLERGIAALDAALAVTLDGRDLDHQPARDGDGPESSLHWGPGTACTSAEIARASLGAAVIDMGRSKGHGIDAVWIEDIETFENELQVRVLTRAPDLTKTWVRFRNVPEGLNPITLTVNRQRVGEFTQTQLRGGIEVRPAFVPSFAYQPPKEVSRHVTWFPHARLDVSSVRSHGARVEIRFGDQRTETVPLIFDSDRGLLIAKEGRDEHRELPIGATLRSRLLFDVAGRTHSEPASGFRTSRVSDYRIVDPGEGAELELVADHRSRIRRFLDGAEFGRHARGDGRFTYRVPVKARTNKLEFLVRAAGRVRVRAGETVLHEDKSTSTPGERRDLALELADHRLWASGEIALTFETVTANDTIDVASIRYRATGRLASVAGLGATTRRRAPDKELRVIVQPLELIDRTLDVDKEALRLTFFGGPDHEITPGPNSQRTVGSVANFVDSLSGGRTTFKGVVLPKRRWEVMARECDGPDAELPGEFVQQMRTTHDNADLVVAILGKSGARDAPLPKPRSIRAGDRRIPVVFLRSRSADGSFLSCGTATSAILGACYGIQPLREPKWGNFGALALTGAGSHVPSGPCGINLARTGWSDHLFLERRDHEKMVISPLASGRVGFVLDCSSLPGRGRLFLECRTIADASPTDSGVLMYWQFVGEKPWLRDLTGRSCTPSILRLSASRHRTATPFVPGDQSDLFRVAVSSLPATTMAGEQLWEIRDSRPLGEGQASFDVRYLAEDLIEASGSKWLAGDSMQGWETLRGWRKDTVRRRDGETWLALPKTSGSRLRLRCDSAEGLFRIFTRIRGIEGHARVVVGAGDETLVATDLRGVTQRRWLQADLPRHKPVWIDIINVGDQEARVGLSEVTRVPRVRPVHRVRPTRIPTTRSTRLMDGVIYGHTFHLVAKGKKLGEAKTPVVLPAGPVALRLRVGLPHGAPSKAEVEFSVTLVNANGKKRVKLLDRQSIRRTGRGQLFLLLAEIESAADDRVEFVKLSWRGETDLYVVDFSIVRLL